MNIERFFSDSFMNYIKGKIKKGGEVIFITIQENNETISQWKFTKNDDGYYGMSMLGDNYEYKLSEKL